MSKKSELAEHRDWQKWGQQFCWKLYGSNARWSATFILGDGSHFPVSRLARDDIDAAMAEKSEHT